MKKLSSLLFLLALLPLMASAYDAKVGGIYYKLTSYNNTATVTHMDDVNYNSVAYTGKVTIPETVKYGGVTYNVTTIGDQAFYECSDLRFVTIPSSVTSIGGRAFYGCSGLTSVTIPNSVTSIGNDAFYFCFGLTDVVIGSGVTSIGHQAFYGCTGLISIEIPDSVTEIGANAFDGCKSLTSVTIGNGVTTIGWGAFNDCTGLTSVVIPDGVTEIGGRAFINCSGIETVTIGSGVKSIGDNAFEMCTGLTDVYCKAKKGPATGDDVFKNAGIPFVTLHVPSASIKGYMASAPWNEFGEVKALEDSEPTPTPDYVRGDANLDGKITIEDAMFIVNKVLKGKYPDEK